MDGACCVDCAVLEKWCRCESDLKVGPVMEWVNEMVHVYARDGRKSLLFMPKVTGDNMWRVTFDGKVVFHGPTLTLALQEYNNHPN